MVVECGRVGSNELMGGLRVASGFGRVDGGRCCRTRGACRLGLSSHRLGRCSSASGGCLASLALFGIRFGCWRRSDAGGTRLLLGVRT